jgi:signal-transduction protein with cAMP-binding, CBS, and nucleotidyltransferase domain
MEVLYAAHLMSNKKIKRLPVVEDEQLIGLVSFSDIANAMMQPMVHLLAGLGASRRVP